MWSCQASVSLFPNSHSVSFNIISLGPIPWLIVAEMFSGKYVAAAMGVSSQLNWACNFIIGLVFPYMSKYLGPYSFAPFALVLLLTFAFAATILPETQGSTPEELQAEMTRTLSKTVVYQPNNDSAEQIDFEWRKAMEQLQHEEEAERKNGVS
jgi:Sugar (and other) transporter